MIKCSKCPAVVCLKFHPGLTPASYRQLTQIYRTQLANCHEDTCPFSMDAKRWLIMNETEPENVPGIGISNESTIVETVVPPFLIPMDKEYFMLQESSYLSNNSGVSTREHILKEAAILRNTIGENRAEFMLSDETKSRIISICNSHNVLQSTSSHPDAHDGEVLSYQNQLSKVFNTTIDSSTGEVSSNQNPNKSNTDLNYILLSLFGWRLDIPKDAHGSQQPCVTCPFCFNSQLCSKILPSLLSKKQSLEGEMKNHGPPSPKRQRVEGAPNTPLPVLENVQFDLINSHRYFCPMVSGFVRKDAVKSKTTKHGTSEPGWELMLSSVCKHKGTSASVSAGDDESKGIIMGNNVKDSDDALDPEKFLQRIRSTLRSPRKSNMTNLICKRINQ